MFSVDVVPGDTGINGELEGAVGGQETRARQESRHPTNLERKKTNLLHLLNRGGMFLHSSTYLLQFTTLSELPRPFFLIEIQIPLSPSRWGGGGGDGPFHRRVGTVEPCSTDIST